jgi:hypothetical protein
MTVLHLKSKAGPDGTVQFDTGVPGAEVDIVASIKGAPISDEQWKKEMGELLDSMGDIHVETYPRTPVRDPWSES